MEFHLIVNGKQEGPFTVEELSQKGITPESEVWAPGMDDWQQAGDVPELTAVLQRAEFEAAQQAARAAENQATVGQPYTPPVPPNYVPPTQTPRYTSPMPEQPRKKNGCLPWVIAGLILAVLLGTMVLTCPSRADHVNAIEEVAEQWVGDKVQENVGIVTGNNGLGGLFSDIIGRLIEELTSKGADRIIDSYLDVDNYMVCSVGSITIAGKKKTVSFGIFGHVFTADKDDIEELWARVMDDSTAMIPSQTQQPNYSTDDSEQDEEEEQIVIPDALPDTIMGIEVPEELDTALSKMINEAMEMAKQWAKDQIDQIGK